MKVNRVILIAAQRPTTARPRPTRTPRRTRWIAPSDSITFRPAQKTIAK